MIHISQLKMPLGHTEKALYKKAAGMLRIPEEEIESVSVVKQSVDARKKPDISYSYVVNVTLKGKGKAGARQEEKLVKRLKDRNITLCEEVPYHLPEPGQEELLYPPVIIGTGPAGLFCGLMLARKGYRPLLLERGEDVDSRTAKVERFWREGKLDPSSNVQFGEGGAGTFSDGKLNTLVKDSSGRNHEVLRILTEFGADPSICYVNKPHIGTDVLSRIVKSIRQEIEKLGGRVRFLSQVTDFEIENGGLAALTVNDSERIPVQAAVLAVGHSARDTFEKLYDRGIPMEAKAFAVGLRIQHPQVMINKSQYGMEQCRELGPASYKLTKQVSNGRGVYSFCMCPGGYVVNASSEPGKLAVNGMSYHDRAGENANSALIVTVTPEDFSHCLKKEKSNGEEKTQCHPLSGIYFQRMLEKKAYDLCRGKIPVQLYGDFKENRVSSGFGQVLPAFRGEYEFANLREMLPEYISDSLLEAMESFGHMIQGFDRPDALFAGIESRTSSPVRIPRDSRMESSICGLFPCGEGAGYAGGITSAGMDGIKTAEEIIRRYHPCLREYGK
ncbi:MAG: NAD(P)/FAD-dependent oxidoreductase [Enterocloster sp.]